MTQRSCCAVAVKNVCLLSCKLQCNMRPQACSPAHLLAGYVMHHAGGAAVICKCEELLCLANAHAKCLLSEHGLPLPESSKTRGTANPFSLPHKTARSTLLVEVETCAVRMAFSHIPLWHAVMQVGRVSCASWV
eukprot:scaffold21092_cov18-Tisochrysis_lutea.AAC.1